MSLITVVIPVGPGHGGYLHNALSSLHLQNESIWNAIVVNDSGGELPSNVYSITAGDSRVAHLATEGKQGAGVARNIGLQQVTTPFVSFLDADDYLTEKSLDMMLRAYAAYQADYIYGDWWVDHGGGNPLHLQIAPQYSQRQHLSQGQHVVTTLLSTSDVKALGGFDSNLRGWEDWEFYCKLAAAGVCGARVAYPVIVYRLHTGLRRESSHKAGHPLVQEIQGRYLKYMEDTNLMGCCGGGNKVYQAKVTERGFAGRVPSQATGTNVVLMEYTGLNRGVLTWRSQRTQQIYKGASIPPHNTAQVFPEDVEWLKGLGVWRVIVSADPVQPTPPTVDVPPPPPPAPPTWKPREADTGAYPTPAPVPAIEDRSSEALAPGEEPAPPALHPGKRAKDGVR